MQGKGKKVLERKRKKGGKKGEAKEGLIPLTISR